MTTRNIQDLFNATAYDVNGEKLGSVNEIFVDEKTGQPTFIEVNHGLFGLSSSLVPLRGHHFANNGDLTLAFDKDRIKDAPEFASDQALDVNEQATIYRHYGVDTIDNVTTYDVAGNGAAYDREANVDADRAAFAGTDAQVDAHREANLDAANTLNDGTLVRSEEQLNVSKENVATDEVRLRKYVVTETETVEVPVTREEVRIERTPISAEEAAALGTSRIGEEEASVILHEERVVVNKETVPVEKVTLGKEVITDTQKVSEELQKERIVTEGVDTIKDNNDLV